jgi:HD-like signal output (HDOD) protein
VATSESGLDRAAGGRGAESGVRDNVRSTLTRLSRTGELPTLPPAALAAMAIARNPDSGVDDLCQVIRRDVGLSSRILRVANSAAYARRVPARALVDAVLTLGLRKTCDLLVAAHARRLFAVAPAHAERLWRHSLASALLADEMARFSGGRNGLLAFLPGLFHDVGRIAFYLATSDPGADTRSEAATVSGKPEAERARYGFDHAEAGAILTEDWGLGPDQVDAIRWHHQPAQAEHGRMLAAILNVADVAAHEMGFGSGSAAPEHVDGTSIGLGDPELETIVERVRETFRTHDSLLS